MLKTLLGSTLLTLAVGALIVPAYATTYTSHSGWICKSTDGDHQEHVDYHSHAGSNGFIENESTTTDVYVGCPIPNIDGAEVLNQFRTRVTDGNDQKGVECWIYRSRINYSGSVSFIEVASASTTAGDVKTETLYMDLYDAGQTDHSNYTYYGKCVLPADDSATSKVFMWQTFSGSTCPGTWEC